MAMQTLSAPRIATARKTETDGQAKAVVIARWRLLDVLKARTLIGVFHSSEAAAAAIESIERRGNAMRVWKACGRVMGNDLREEWKGRSLLRRIVGFGDERRVVEGLARDLEAGSMLVAVRTRDGKAPDELLPGATHLIRVNTWSFGFLR